jgi:hypothetical protein
MMSDLNHPLRALRAHRDYRLTPGEWLTCCAWALLLGICVVGETLETLFA